MLGPPGPWVSSRKHLSPQLTMNLLALILGNISRITNWDTSWALFWVESEKRDNESRLKATKEAMFICITEVEGRGLGPGGRRVCL